MRAEECVVGAVVTLKCSCTARLIQPRLNTIDIQLVTVRCAEHGLMSVGKAEEVRVGE